MRYVMNGNFKNPERTNNMTKLLLRNPALVIGAYFAFGAIALIALSLQHNKDIRETTSLRAAEAYLQAVTVMRGYYSKHVVPRAREAGATIAQDFRSSKTAIPFPATLTIELAEEMRRESGAFSFNFYSDYPFPSRKGRTLDKFETDALDALNKGDRERFISFETVGGVQAARVAEPVIMGQTCVACHNAHPDSPRQDWKIGDFRGVQQATVVIPDGGATFVSDMSRSAPFMFGFVFLGFGLILILFRELKRRIDESQKLTSITEQKNRELAAANAAVELSNRAQGELIANVGHELRTPLNHVIGFSEILKEQRMGPIGSPEYQVFAEDIHRGGTRLLEIINTILMISRLESGGEGLVPERLDVSDVMEKSVSAHQEDARKSGIRLTYTKPDEPAVVTFDRGCFVQMTDCLIDNAIKFTNAGGEVSVSTRDNETGGIAVTICDDGAGISPELVDEIFKPFRQADGGTDRQFEGMGLGLTIARTIARLHGADLDIESRLGNGTVVTIVIPEYSASAGKIPQLPRAASDLAA